MSTSAVSVLPRVVHAIAPYTGESPLAGRQALFLESVDRAERDGCLLLAGSPRAWTRRGWTSRPLRRDASVFGEPSSKPFLKDLLDLALETAGPGDWILYSNVDCAIAPDLYINLCGRRATVVEYQRRDVLGDPQSLSELFANPRAAYPLGLDALAIRAHYYEEIRDRLPDFVIGEPHWDTIYSGILRRLGPVRRDSSRLLHPKHQQMWDLGRPTAAGRHNHELFVESLEHGDSEKTTLAPDSDDTDTAVVAVVFGSDPARVKANEEGIRQQLRQDLDADYYLVEMLSGGASAYPADLLASVRHIPVRSGEGAEELFQKEALQNVGWRAALARHPYEYLIFPDADVYAEDLDWFRRIRDRLRHDPSRAVHGYRRVRDSIDPHLHYCSLGASFVFGQPNDLPLNPGICWGLHRELVEAGDGFNPFTLGAGDSAFVAEYLNTAAMQYDPWLAQWTWYREIERKLPFYAGLDCVETDLVHVHHGFAARRTYDGYRYALDALPPLSEFVHLTDTGILAWNDPNGRERRLLGEQRHMSSRAAVDELLTRHGLSRHVRPVQLTAEPAAPRPYFRPRAAAVDVAPQSAGVHHDAHRRGLRIFDPDQVFRLDFPFSWCDGVARLVGSTYIPIVDGDEFALLRLDGLADAPYVVGALPIQPNWQPHDVRGYDALAFRMRLTGTIPDDLRVTLTSTMPDGREPESQPVRLAAQNEAGAWTPMSVPLSSFTGEGFDLGGVRLVKFAGSGGFCLELAEIYLVRGEDA